MSKSWMRKTALYSLFKATPEGPPNQLLFGPDTYNRPQPTIHERLNLIEAKLDTIIAKLEPISRRL